MNRPNYRLKRKVSRLCSGVPLGYVQAARKGPFLTEMREQQFKKKNVIRQERTNCGLLVLFLGATADLSS